MGLPRRFLRVVAAISLCLIAVLVSTTGANGFMPGEWDGEWISAFGHSSGKVYMQIYPAASNLIGAMRLTNSPCTDETPLTGTLQQGVLTLGASCSGCRLTFTVADSQDTPLTGQYDIYCGGKFYDQGAFSFRYSGPWQNPQDLGNGWWYDWIGYFNASYCPWIYHDSLGWLYPFPASGDGTWFWDPQWEHRGGWWWTSASVYPWVYSATDGAWFYYAAENSTPGARWFCNSAGCAER